MKLLSSLAVILGFTTLAPAQIPTFQDNLAASSATAVAYLKSKQAENGSWGDGPNAAGMTGIVVTGLIKGGNLTADDPAVAKALKYIESLIDSKEGHIAGPQAKAGQFNYPTCANLLALVAADPEGKKYRTVIDSAAKCLIKYQWDEGEGKKPSDVVYGGAGYGGGSRPDLSNTQFFLDALLAARVPSSDPAFRKAAVFVSRCQNFKSEYQDQPWAATINDGSFIYTATGETRGGTNDDGTKPGYGSMTYAGVKCLVVGGVSRDDMRCKKALEWLAKNYTVDLNPGMPEGSGLRGFYYYLMSMSRCLEVLGEDQFASSDGKKHDWRREIATALMNRQHKDGSWSNDIGNWMEADPVLCTAYSLVTLGTCRVKKVDIDGPRIRRKYPFETKS